MLNSQRIYRVSKSTERNNKHMKKWRLFAIGFGLCALLGAAFVSLTKTSSGTTETEEYYQQIRNGLAEINIPASNNINSINSAPGSLSNFIYYRSGVQLSSVNKNALRSAEQNAWNDSKRVDAATLTQILTDIAIERIPTLSDAEIAGITELSRPFNAPSLPQSFQLSRRNVLLRASGYGRMPTEQFSSELTDLRNGGIQGRVAKNLIYVSLADEVNGLVDTLRNVDPQFFGGTKSSMTPTQALLVAYAVIADDALTDNQAGLSQKMLDVQQLNVRATNTSFPSPVGFKAYGDNGYLHSSPTSIILNDASVSRLLTLIQERGQGVQ